MVHTSCLVQHLNLVCLEKFRVHSALQIVHGACIEIGINTSPLLVDAGLGFLQVVGAAVLIKPLPRHTAVVLRRVCDERLLQIILVHLQLGVGQVVTHLDKNLQER